MPTYKIHAGEIWGVDFIVEAESADEAIEMVENGTVLPDERYFGELVNVEVLEELEISCPAS